MEVRYIGVRFKAKPFENEAETALRRKCAKSLTISPFHRNFRTLDGFCFKSYASVFIPCNELEVDEETGNSLLPEGFTSSGVMVPASALGALIQQFAHHALSQRLRVIATTVRAQNCASIRFSNQGLQIDFAFSIRFGIRGDWQGAVRA